MTQVTSETLTSLSVRLKEETTSTHESLDKRIMSLSPFTDLERYRLFVRTQYRLHMAVSQWYNSAELQALLPELSFRDRAEAVLQDCQDVEVSAQAIAADKQVAAEVSINNTYEALGWLYTVEGSNMGAGFLLKYVCKHLPISEEKGARHMKAHESGRREHWQAFKAHLDLLDVTEEQQQQMIQGSINAFAYARNNAEQLLATH